MLAATLAHPLFAAGTSWAADNQVINGQVQLGDVFSNQTLNVEEASEGLSGSANAVGNIVSATGAAASLDFQSDQALMGHVEAGTSATVNGYSGPYFATSTSATGNSATGGTCCAGTTGSSLQTMETGSAVAADAYGQVGGSVQDAQADASAVGNTTGWSANNGGVQTWTAQTSAGLTSATNTAVFNTMTGYGGFTATAVANNVTLDTEDSGADLGVSQETTGQGAQAVIGLSVASANDIEGATSGVGNNVDAQTTGSTPSMNVVQNNGAPVTAYTDMQLENWSGQANASAYGVGNSVILSNAGPRSNLWSDQNTSGDVTANASFTGGAGGSVYASSTAMGNAASGYACSECGGVLQATNNQVSSSRVRSSANVVIHGRARQVNADSTAVGNSAAYEVHSGN